MNKIKCKYFSRVTLRINCSVEEIGHGNQEVVSASTASSS